MHPVRASSAPLLFLTQRCPTLRRLVNAASAAMGGVAAALFSQRTFDASKAPSLHSF